MTTTTTGAKYTLRLVGNFAEVHIHGVSGSLNNQLAIKRIELRHPDFELVADDVKLQWKPSSLFSRHILLNYVRINNLQVASKPGDDTPLTLPNSLQLPESIDLFSVDELAVNHLQFSFLNDNEEPLQFSALKAQVLIDLTKYQLHFSGDTPWGSAKLEGGFETKSPFQTQAQITWRGLANEQHGILLPATEAHGTLTGSWKSLLLEAQFDVKSDSTQQKDAASGYVNAVLTPFKQLPIESLQMDLDSVDPSIFYADAPRGDLQLKADLKITEDEKTPTIKGQINIANALPITWDKGGIPIVKLSSELVANEHQVSWQAMKMTLEDGGLVTGSGHLGFSPLARLRERGGGEGREYGRNVDKCEKSGTKKSELDLTSNDCSPTNDPLPNPLPLAGEGVSLPNITALVDLKNINLLRIDSRLKKTKLNGTIQSESIKTGLQFALNLRDSHPQNLNANLVADMQLSHDQVLSLNKIELRAKEASLTAQGTVALRDKQEFVLQGDARNLNPARWINVPEGHIATRFNVTGQIQQGWRVDAKVSKLSGQFAGLNLHGESDLVAQQDKLISIKKLELNWGNSHLSAKGDWSLTGARQYDQLKFNLALPELSALSEPFKKIIPSLSPNLSPASGREGRNESLRDFHVNEKFQGSLYIDGTLTGNIKQPGGHLNIKADNTRIPGIVELEKLQATVALESGKQGKMSGNLDATGLQIGGTYATGEGIEISHLKASLSGLRHAHQLQMSAALSKKYRVELQANGDMQESRTGSAQWHGSVQQLDLSGPSDLQLVSPFNLQISSNAVQMSLANWQGKLGKLQAQQLEWSHGQLKTKGQIQNLSVVNALKLWRARLPVIGDLQVDADWNFVIGQQAEGQFDIKRTSGDLKLQDVSGGYSQTFALGLQNFLVTGRVGQTGARASLHQPVDVQLHVLGTQLGQVEANFRSTVSRTAHGWSMAANAPLSGSAKLQTKDIQWLGRLMSLGSSGSSSTSGVALLGELEAEAEFAGTREHPTYSAQIKGKELQVSLAELGVILPNGILDASIEKTELKVNKLQFSQTIKAPQVNQRRQDQLIDFSKLGLLNETGYAEASGVIDLRTGQGSIKAHWQRFPFLQTEEGWLVATGDAQLTEGEKSWNLTGQLLADAAYFSVPKQAPPKLSNDVVVIKKNDKRTVASVEKATGLQSSVDFNIKTGNNFVFVGRGLNTRLSGDIRIRIQNDGPVLATGLIQTTGGTYEGYGQQLAIERGILNFQGPLDNPTLNVRALRKNLPVEAGVEVVGTVAKPEVRLISEPNVPDQDKLSWMILGHGSDQMGGSEAGLLMTAASAILGGDSDSNIPREIARTFGLDDISVSTSSSSPESQLPSQTVAGSISNSMSTDQVFTVGKHITPDLVFSVERSLTDATNGVKLTWKLTRRFSVIGRAGNDTSMDGQYLFSFN
jgi:translocation and assembly module TamB